MTISLDNWQERKTKQDVVYHNFNAAIDYGSGVLYTMGWQLFNGVINPPSFRSGGWRYYPMLLSSGDFPHEMYEAVKACPQRQERNLTLREEHEAVAGLTASSMDFARLFPTV